MRYTANIFIVPNPTFEVGESCSPSWQERIKEEWATMFGVELTSQTKVVEIWTISDSPETEDRNEYSDNWAAGKPPKKIPFNGNWPRFFPIEILPKKEGESITIKSGEDEFILTANQTNYRYAWKTFEDMLEHVNGGYKKVLQ